METIDDGPGDECESCGHATVDLDRGFDALKTAPDGTEVKVARYVCSFCRETDVDCCWSGSDDAALVMGGINRGLNILFEKLSEKIDQVARGEDW